MDRDTGLRVDDSIQGASQRPPLLDRCGRSRWAKAMCHEEKTHTIPAFGGKPATKRREEALFDFLDGLRKGNCARRHTLACFR